VFPEQLEDMNSAETSSDTIMGKIESESLKVLVSLKTGLVCQTSE
jgi:hypothetical protein